MRDEIRSALRRSQKVLLRGLFFTTAEKRGLRDGVQAFFEELGLKEHWEAFHYCVLELISNAQRALIKRVYFEQQGLAIEQRSSYHQGMAKFKRALQRDGQHFQDQLTQRGDFVELAVEMAEGRLEVSVSNRGELSPEEEQRVRKRLELAAVLNSLVEAEQDIHDEEEGSGYGLFMAALVVRNLGGSSKGLTFTSEGGQTMARISLPVSHLGQVELGQLNNALIQAVQSLPNLPEHIQRLQQLIQQPEANFHEIAGLIEQDHSLTAELLRLVNSVVASPTSRVVNVKRAAVLLGLKGIEQLLISIGVEKVLNLSRHRELWQHSRDCAFLTRHLLVYRGVNRDLVSLGYVAGLLHDIGDAVLLEVSQPVYQLFQSLKPLHPHMTRKTLEFVQAGYNHVELGGLLAQKWKFPSVLELSIRHHHHPLNAPVHTRFLTSAVYCADLFLRYPSGDVPEVYLEQGVLKLLGLESEQLFYMTREVMLSQLSQDERTL